MAIIAVTVLPKHWNDILYIQSFSPCLCICLSLWICICFFLCLSFYQYELICSSQTMPLWDCGSDSSSYNFELFTLALFTNCSYSVFQLFLAGPDWPGQCRFSTSKEAAGKTLLRLIPMNLLWDRKEERSCWRGNATAHTSLSLL